MKDNELQIIKQLTGVSPDQIKLANDGFEVVVTSLTILTKLETLWMSATKNCGRQCWMPMEQTMYYERKSGSRC